MHDAPTIYNAFGSTIAAPITLTASFADNVSTFFCRGFKRFRIEGAFVPGVGSTNSQAVVEFSTSMDIANNGPTNWFPFSVDSTGTTEVDVFADSGYLEGSNGGIPLVIPGDKTSTAGVSIPYSEPYDELSSEWLRIRARDSGAANFGTLSLRVTFFPN